MNTYYVDESENYNHPGLYYMAKSIDAMAQVDAVYFTKDWMLARGCKIEREIAKAYGVKILDTDFLEEKEELVRTPNEMRIAAGVAPIQLCENAVVGKHFKDGEFDMTTAKKSGPIDPLDPLSRWYEDE